MSNRKAKDRMIGMLLTDKKFADAVFADPSGVLSDLGFSEEEISCVAALPKEAFTHLADKLDARLTQDKLTSSKQCFDDNPAS